jgi:hypothetical protein
LTVDPYRKIRKVGRQLVRVMPTMAWSRTLLVGLVVAVLVGCGGTPRPPLYTPEELRATCERQGGWWRPNILDGYCEYQSPGWM